MNQLLDQELTTNVHSTIVSNFAFLESENLQLAKLGFLAEEYLETDPITKCDDKKSA